MNRPAISADGVRSAETVRTLRSEPPVRQAAGMAGQVALAQDNAVSASLALPGTEIHNTAAIETSVARIIADLRLVIMVCYLDKNEPEERDQQIKSEPIELFQIILRRQGLRGKYLPMFES